MSFKPIEPGCLAIVIAGNRIGDIVEVLEWVNDRDPFHGYIIDGCGWGVDFQDGQVGVYQPSALVRIDGGEDESLMVEDEQEVSA